MDWTTNDALRREVKHDPREVQDEQPGDRARLSEMFPGLPAGPFTRGVDVTLAEPEDIDQLSRVVAAAFHDLNASRFLIPDGTTAARSTRISSG